MLLILQSSISEWVMRELRLTQMSLWMSDEGLIESLPECERRFDAEGVFCSSLLAGRVTVWHLRLKKNSWKHHLAQPKGKHKPQVALCLLGLKHLQIQAACVFCRWRFNLLRNYWDICEENKWDIWGEARTLSVFCQYELKHWIKKHICLVC